VISAPLGSVREVYVPRECLNVVAKLNHKDSLQKMMLAFINLLSSESGIATQDFGIHGSIALNMHTIESDIDIVVYGAQNFRKLERTIQKLVDAGTLSYLFNNRLDAARKHKGRYLNRIFMYNAVRKPEEINSAFGTHNFTTLTFVKFSCKIKDDSEAMFRPAIYKIKDCKPADPVSVFPKEKIPELVVSMIGCYRNVAKRGDKVRVAGMLERVENLETGEIFHQVVVGTGTNEEEYIWPF